MLYIKCRHVFIPVAIVYIIVYLLPTVGTTFMPQCLEKKGRDRGNCSGKKHVH